MNTKETSAKIKKSKVIFPVLIILLSVIVIVQTVIIIDMKFSDDTPADTQQIFNSTIETPVVDLVYNMEFVDGIKAEVSQEAPYFVTFTSDVGEVKDIKLFTLYFNDENKGELVGIIEDKNKNDITVSVEENTFTSAIGLNEIEISELTSLQVDMLDEIFSNMTFKSLNNSSDVNSQTTEYIVIETPYARLNFPKEWEEYLVVEQKDGEFYEVKFYCDLPERDPIELFTYVFGDEAEIPVGFINEVAIGISVGKDEADDTWTEEEKTIFYTMREEMGSVINELMDTDGFEMN